MDSGEWFPGIPDASRGQQITFITMSTVDDLSYSPSENQKNRDAAQVAATGRRNWKTLRGKPEAVWPPALENALIEALEEYQKVETRPTTSKYGVRYPMRNRFISDYIFEKTGKLRTAKQVGSRLQQLRDTCKDEKLSSLLGKAPIQGREFKAETSQSPSPAAFELSASPAPVEEPSQVVVYMQIEYPDQHMQQPYHVPRIQFVPNDMSTPHPLYLLPITQQHSATSATPSIRAFHSALSMFSSCIEIASPWGLMPETRWSVYKDETMVHSSTSMLRVRSATVPGSDWLYTCDIVPSFWQNLCESEDPNCITIVQVLRSSSTSDESSSLAHAISMVRPTEKEVSVVYHFNFPDRRMLKDRRTMSVENPGLSSAHHSSHVSRPNPAPRTSTYPGSSTGHSSANWPSSSKDDSFSPRGRSFEYSSAGNRMNQSLAPLMADNNQEYSLYYNSRATNYSEPRSQMGLEYDMDEAIPPTLYGEVRSAQWNTNSAQAITYPPSFSRREAVPSFNGSTYY